MKPIANRYSSPSPCLFLSLLLLFLPACAQIAAPKRLVGTPVWLSQVSAEKAFAAAVKAVQGEYRIDRLDRHNYVLVTVPREYSAREDTGTLADQLTRVRHTLRRIARIRVYSAEGTKTMVSVRVEVQRYDTPIARAFAFQERRTDTPGTTPIDEASPSRRRNELWTYIRRDRPEEQKIIAAIRAMVEERR